MTLPTLIACGAKQSVAPTISAILPVSENVPATQSIPQPPADSAPTQSLLGNAESFPNAENYRWEKMIAGLSRPVDS